MTKERLLKELVKLLMQALRETRGGQASLGRLMMGRPDLFVELMKAADEADAAQISVEAGVSYRVRNGATVTITRAEGDGFLGDFGFCNRNLSYRRDGKYVGRGAQPEDSWDIVALAGQTAAPVPSVALVEELVRELGVAEGRLMSLDNMNHPAIPDNSDVIDRIRRVVKVAETQAAVPAPGDGLEPWQAMYALDNILNYMRDPGAHPYPGGASDVIRTFVKQRSHAGEKIHVG